MTNIMPTAASLPGPNKHQAKSTYLFALGSNGNFQLGLSHDNDTNTPERCIFNVKPSTSSQSSSNANDTRHKHISMRIPLYSNEEIFVLASGGNHTLLLTTQGHVFAAGSNEHGQLGLTPPSSGLTPSTRPMSSSEPKTTVPPGFHLLHWTGPSPSLQITHIAATFTASLLISSSTTLYTVGHGPKGELALGTDITHATVPTLSFDIREHEGENSRIDKLVACMDHALLLSSNGNVYGWGNARKGQIGEKLRTESNTTTSNGGTRGVIWKVSRTEMDMQSGLSFRPRQLVTARDFTVIAGEEGDQHKLYGKTGLILPTDLSVRSETTSAIPKCNNDERDSDTEILLKKSTPTLHTGWSTLTAHDTSTSTLAGYGPGTRGQLPPANLARGSQLAVGSEHSVALLHDGTVVSWGWGEHGNCGEDVDERGVVGGGKWNVLWRPGDWKGKGKTMSVRGVGAGCASSFFWIEVEGDGGGDG